MRRYFSGFLIFAVLLVVGCSNTNTDLRNEHTSSNTRTKISSTTITTETYFDAIGEGLKQGAGKLHPRAATPTTGLHAASASEPRTNDAPVPSGQPATVVPEQRDVYWSLFGCETGGTYNAAINTGNGFYGAFQFSASTWRSVGGTGLPHQHSYDVQKSFAIRLQERSGWGQWPKCGCKLRLNTPGNCAKLGYRYG